MRHNMTRVELTAPTAASLALLVSYATVLVAGTEKAPTDSLVDATWTTWQGM